MTSRVSALATTLVLGVCGSLFNVSSARADGLPPPQCVEAVVMAKDQVRVSWKAVAGAKQYVVRSLDEKDATKQNVSLSATLLTHSFSIGAKPLSEYRYKVGTVGDDGAAPSLWSNVVTAYIPGENLFVFGYDFSKDDSGFDIFRSFDGLWTSGNGVLRQEQNVDAARIRKYVLALTDTSAPKAPDSVKDLSAQQSLRVTAKIRIEQMGDKNPAFVGLGVGTDSANGNGYGFVFYNKGQVAFINDPPALADAPAAAAPDPGAPVGKGAGSTDAGASGGKTAAATVAEIPKTQPTLGSVFSYDWKVGEEYWVSLARDGDELKAAIWPVCTEEPRGWDFVQNVKDLSKPVTDKQGKAVNDKDGKAQTTARATGYPALIGGYEKTVKASFDDVKVVLLSTTKVPAEGKPTLAPTPSPCDPAVNPFANRSKDSFSRDVEVWALKSDQRNAPDEAEFEQLAMSKSMHSSVAATPCGRALAALQALFAPSGHDACEVARLRFDCAANFPLKEFGRCGEVYEEDGAIIHEGMRILVNSRGDYLVRFNVSAPATPVTLRLQLKIDVPETNRKIRLTLPAVDITPNGASPEFYKPAAYGVSVPGHSEAIAELFTKIQKISPAQCDDRTVLSRSGSARFGVTYLGTEENPAEGPRSVSHR